MSGTQPARTTFRRMRTVLPVCLVAGLALAACSSAAKTAGGSGNGDSGGGTKSISVAYCAPTASQSVAWVPLDAGIYSKYGLKVSISFVPLAQQIAQVTAGRVDFAFCDATATTSAALAGAKIVSLSPLLSTMQAPIYGAPGITSAAQLKGKAVGDWGPNPNVVTATMNYALGKMGFKTTDVQHRTFTGTADMMGALLTGQVKAAPVFPPDTLRARTNKLTLLYNTPADNEPWAAASLYTRRSEDPDTVTRFLKSYLDGIQFIKHPKTNQSVVEQSIMKQLKITDETIAHEGETYFISGTKDVPEWSDALMQKTLDNLSSVRPDAKTAKPGDYYDNGPIEALRQSGFITQLMASYQGK